MLVIPILIVLAYGSWHQHAVYIDKQEIVAEEAKAFPECTDK